MPSSYGVRGGFPSTDGTAQANMMKCVICGRASSPGAKLCSDCSSARKRAFAATVTQPLLEAAGGRTRGRLLRPSQSVAATARRAAERALNSKQLPVAPVASSRRMDLVFLVAALVVVLVIATYIARQIQKSRHAEEPQVAEQPAPTNAGAMSNAVSVMPPGLSPKNVAETRPPNMTGAIPADESAPMPAPQVKRANAKPRNVPIEVVPVPAEPVPEPVAVAPMPMPVPEVRVAPKPDPMQLMAEGLARCATGGLFDRILCDQRVRREYCDGRWGQVPQCPSGVPNDHGQ